MASTSARTKGMPSANGRLPAPMRSRPDTFTQAPGRSARPSSARKAGASSPSAARTRPMWSITKGSGSARRRQQPGQLGAVQMQAQVPAQRRDQADHMVEDGRVRRAAQMGHEVEAGPAHAGVVQRAYRRWGRIRPSSATPR